MKKILEFVGECKDGGAPASIDVGGITYISRYAFWEEFAEIHEGVKKLSLGKSHRIEEIFCDSQAQWVYTITFKDGTNKDFAYLACCDFSDGIISNPNGVGGHNGVWMVLNGENDSIVSPYWS